MPHSALPRLVQSRRPSQALLTALKTRVMDSDLPMDTSLLFNTHVQPCRRNGDKTQNQLFSLATFVFIECVFLLRGASSRCETLDAQEAVQGAAPAPSNRNPAVVASTVLIYFHSFWR
jgi:hypothetical protein